MPFLLIFCSHFLVKVAMFQPSGYKNKNTGCKIKMKITLTGNQMLFKFTQCLGKSQLYGNKIANRIKFKTKTAYYLELLTPETMKLLGVFQI